MDDDGQLPLTPGLLLYCSPYLAHCGAGSPGKMLHWQICVGTSVHLSVRPSSTWLELLMWGQG